LRLRLTSAQAARRLRRHRRYCSEFMVFNTSIWGPRGPSKLRLSSLHRDIAGVSVALSRPSNYLSHDALV
jgi:hypothetical protein